MRLCFMVCGRRAWIAGLRQRNTHAHIASILFWSVQFEVRVVQERHALSWIVIWTSNLYNVLDDGASTFYCLPLESRERTRVFFLHMTLPALRLLCSQTYIHIYIAPRNARRSGCCLFCRAREYRYTCPRWCYTFLEPRSLILERVSG